MKFNINVTIVVFVCVVSLYLVRGSEEPVRCYVCNSFVDETCKSGKLTEKHLTNCSSLKHGSKYKYCRTITQTIDFKMLTMEGGSRVIRQCAERWDQKRTCYNKGGLGGRATVCHCQGDGCNSASLPASVILTVFLSLALSLVLL